jgi:hypothetical protein
MRLVEEGFGESIPAVVIRVYSVRLTVAGEASLRSATHLEQLPKILTSTVLHRFGPSLQIAASANFGFSPARAIGDHSIPNLLTVKIFANSWRDVAARRGVASKRFVKALHTVSSVGEGRSRGGIADSCERILDWHAPHGRDRRRVRRDESVTDLTGRRFRRRD